MGSVGRWEWVRGWGELGCRGMVCIDNTGGSGIVC